jgi:flagellar hook-associated protein 3 FlgL
MSDVSRVTQQSATMLMIANLQGSLSNLTQLQQQAATGKSINQPSDNPTGTSQVLSLNAQLGRFQQYSSNITDGQSWLNTADSALGSVIKELNQVQTDVLSGANATAQDPTSRQALSQQVLAIKTQLLSLSATQYNNRPVFSGTYGTDPYPQGGASGVSDPTSPSYNPATAYAYAGSTTPVTRMVAPGQKAAVSITGDQVFGSGSSSVFALLDTISKDLTSGNTAALSGTDLAGLQSALGTATQAQGTVGALGAGLNTGQTQVGNMVTSLQDQVANISNANEAQVLSELNLAEISYQAALGTTAKVVQPSLAQFLA